MNTLLHWHSDKFHIFDNYCSIPRDGREPWRRSHSKRVHWGVHFFIFIHYLFLFIIHNLIFSIYCRRAWLRRSSAQCWRWRSSTCSSPRTSLATTSSNNSREQQRNTRSRPSCHQISATPDLVQDHNNTRTRSSLSWDQITKTPDLVQVGTRLL